MMRQSCETAAAAADDDDEDDNSDDDSGHADDDDADDGLTRTANNLKVFCCSSTEFLKLSGKLTKDGPAQVYQSISQSIQNNCIAPPAQSWTAALNN